MRLFTNTNNRGAQVQRTEQEADGNVCSLVSSILHVYSCTGANSKVHYFYLQQNVCWLASSDQAKGRERAEWEVGKGQIREEEEERQRGFGDMRNELLSMCSETASTPPDCDRGSLSKCMQIEIQIQTHKLNTGSFCICMRERWSLINSVSSTP